jgi:hypothetical protein
MSSQWTEPFAIFEQKLSEWLAHAVEPPSQPPPRQTEPAFLRMFEERLKRLQTYLDKADRDAEQALSPLTTDIQELRQWLDALSTARANLVERTVRSVAD